MTDLEPRLALLRAASRPDEPLTDRNGPTAQGNIISAITKLERERALVMTQPSLAQQLARREMERISQLRRDLSDANDRHDSIRCSEIAAELRAHGLEP